MKTKKQYEEYLNDLYYKQDITQITGEYCYMPPGLLRQGKLGTALRKHDPIQFECGFDEWKNNQ